MATEVQTREIAQAKLVQRAIDDPAFREALKRDPRGVIVAEFGVPVPANVTIDVLEETPAHYYVVLPAPADAARDAELDDEALSEVAGGGGGSNGKGTQVVD